MLYYRTHIAPPISLNNICALRIVHFIFRDQCFKSIPSISCDSILFMNNKIKETLQSTRTFLSFVLRRAAFFTTNLVIKKCTRWLRNTYECIIFKCSLQKLTLDAKATTIINFQNMNSLRVGGWGIKIKPYGPW